MTPLPPTPTPAPPPPPPPPRFDLFSKLYVQCTHSWPTLWNVFRMACQNCVIFIFWNIWPTVWITFRHVQVVLQSRSRNYFEDPEPELELFWGSGAGAWIILRVRSQSRNYFEDPEPEPELFWGPELEPELFWGSGAGAWIICVINFDCSKVQLKAARMNKNSFLPLLRHVSYVTEIIHFKVAM